MSKAVIVKSVSGGPGLMNLTAAGKKSFLWREVLFLMDRSLLPEGRGSNCLSPG